MPIIALSVGPRNVPRAAISRAIAVVVCMACSIESTPASTACMIPSAPIACAATPRAHADLLPDRRPHRVGPVDLSPDADVVTVAARDRERTTGGGDAWARDAALLDRPRQVDDAHAAEVPHRRHATLEMLAGVDGPLDRAE